MSDFKSSPELEAVLARYKYGPQDGIFTDGSARPNPGPGGWGVVWVDGGKIRAQHCGHESETTTNNRMELTALIEAFRMVKPTDGAIDVYSDSELCVKTINEWAHSWARNNWKRKAGPIKNLDLVQELFALSKERSNISLKWIGGHEGWRWNEYADALSTAWCRGDL